VVAVKKDWIRGRPGWDRISAVRNNQLYEVKSAFILQPGPAAVTEGLRQYAILPHTLNQHVDAALLPKEKSDVASGLSSPLNQRRSLS
jgi:iron complex transport system substrate-binding protein